MANPLLVAENLHLEFPTQVVFDSLSLGVEEGDRVGIVGANGGGKTSLLRMLTGSLEPQSGRVITRGGLELGMLSQSDHADQTMTVREAVVGEVPEHVWAGNPRTRDIIDGLVSDLPWEGRIGELSGGERRRVQLAALLVGDWDLLVLDEPTNHLDVEGVAWLADHLNSRWVKNQGGLLVVTHDRWFLDQVCTETWEVHSGDVEPFEGGYAAYVLQRVERDRMAASAEAKRQNLLRKELAWLRRGPPARTSKPRFRIDAANQLIQDVPPIRDSIELERLAVARLGKDVVDLEGVGVGYDGNEVLDDITWRIAPGERTGIIGGNGTGKSTLLALIAGTLEPSTGRVKRGKTAKVEILDQQFSQLKEIEGDRVREVLGRTKTTFLVEGKEMTPAALLERLGFSKAHLSARVGELSGGQKRRLQLLLVLLAEPNVILLDEPTNDVDHQMLNAMEDLLDSWPGTLIVVSHDRYLLERVTDQQYAVMDGKLRHLPGGVDEYLSLRAKQKRARGQAAAPEAQAPKDTSVLSGAELHARRKELAAVERKVAKLGQQVLVLQQKMADMDPSDYQSLAEFASQLQSLQLERDKNEERWLELSELLD